MEKLKMHSPDFTEENIAKLAELFPNCVTEAEDGDGEVKAAIDFDLLRQELSDHVVEGPRERYRLDWPGKKEALLAANAPIAKTLRPCREESVDFDTTKNLFIEGDNLEALKLLQENYLGKVKMIYIDPPYNTGKDFVYDDDFRESASEYLAKSNQVVEGGERLIANSETNGRFHSDWLSMMYSRLKLARGLLSDGGLIMVSIDDAECLNLGKLLDQVFGPENHLATLIRRRRMATGMRSNPLSPDHEYVVCYCRSNDTVRINGLQKARGDFPLSDGISIYRSTDLTVGMTREMRPNQFYPIKNPDTGEEFLPSESRVWRFDQTTMSSQIEKKNIIWPDSSENSTMNRPRFKTRLLPEDAKKLSNPVSTWLSNRSNSVLPFQLEAPLNQAATREVRELFGAQFLEYPKPVRLIASLIHVGADKDSIILDFFSGSGTTAHATMQLNADDGGRRRHIMVQLPEICNNSSEAYKAGYSTIAEIAKERIRRAGAKIKADNADKPGIENLDTGFRVLKIDTSNMRDVYYAPDAINQDDLFTQTDNIKPDRSGEDLLFQVLLDWGVDLSLPITEETIEGKTVFFVDDNALVACFETGVTEDLIKALAARTPLRAVFRDAGFADDSTRINAEEIFKVLSPATEVKAI